MAFANQPQQDLKTIKKQQMLPFHGNNFSWLEFPNRWCSLELAWEGGSRLICYLFLYRVLSFILFTKQGNYNTSLNKKHMM